MADTFIPRLRGNTFFLFLLRAAKQELGVAPSWGTTSSGLTQAGLFAALMRTMQSDYTVPNEKTLGQYISQYLKGERTNSGTYYPFKSAAFQSGAALRMGSDYPGALSDMDSLCRTFLRMEDDATNRLLIGGLVTLIGKDDSIPCAETFQTGYRTVSRKDIGSETEFILQPFLLSVWYYIVVNKPEAAEGADTYMRWTEDAGSGNPRQIKTNWGEDKAKSIAVSTRIKIYEQEEDAQEAEGDTVQDEEIHIEEEPRIETYEAPFVDPVTHKQVVAAFHVEASGNGTAIGQVIGNVVIGRRGNKDE